MLNYFWGIRSIYVVRVLFECPKLENIFTSGNSGEGVFIYSIKRSCLVEQGSYPADCLQTSQVCVLTKTD